MSETLPRPDYVIRVFMTTDEDERYYITKPTGSNSLSSVTGVMNLYTETKNGMFIIEHDEGLAIYPLASIVRVKIFEYGSD